MPRNGTPSGSKGASPPQAAGDRPAGDPALQQETLSRALAELEARNKKLGASRDRLLAEFEAQAEEVDRLAGDNARLAEEIDGLKRVVAAYDAQLQEVKRSRPTNANPSQAQLQDLSAELLRTALYSGQLGRSVINVLGSIERRLLAMKARTPNLAIDPPDN